MSPWRPPRTCPQCGLTIAAAPCPACARARLPALREAHPDSGAGNYDAHWQALAREAIALHLATVGPICPGFARPPHPSTDLTADHVDPEKREDLTLDDVAVLCRSCNARKGNRRRTS